MDFRPGEDVIDLSHLNHPTLFYDTFVDAPFLFRGREALVDDPQSGNVSMPGQIRFEHRGATAVIELALAEAPAFAAGDVVEARADGIPDAEIVPLGRHELPAEDFLL